MQIRYSKQAEGFLTKIPYKHSKNIREKIFQYSENPESLKNMVKKLQGMPRYRLRVGSYRVIFDDNGYILFIERIETRGNVYK
jgi:mRNA interferase RelE/StbE